MGSWSLSRKILIGIMALFILSLLRLTDLLTPYVVLAPVDIFPGLELWRLVSYPLATGFLGLIVGSIVFSTPAEELEQMLGTRQFGMLLLLVLVTAGVIHTALFFGTGLPMAGISNIALFVLVGFVYLFPHSDVRILFFSVRSLYVLAALIALVLVSTIYSSVAGGTTLLSFFSIGGFGLLLGAAYFHLRFQKYPFLLRPIRSMERMAGKGKPVPIAHKPVAAPRRASVSQPVRVRIPFQKAQGRDLSDEERLNVILDKINEKSYGSLTDDEKRFLSEYSGRL